MTPIPDIVNSHIRLSRELHEEPEGIASDGQLTAPPTVLTPKLHVVPSKESCVETPTRNQTRSDALYTQFD